MVTLKSLRVSNCCCVMGNETSTVPFCSAPGGIFISTARGRPVSRQIRIAGEIAIVIAGGRRLVGLSALFGFDVGLDALDVERLVTDVAQRDLQKDHRARHVGGLAEIGRVDAALCYRFGALEVGDGPDHDGNHRQGDRNGRGRGQGALGTIELFGDGRVRRRTPVWSACSGWGYRAWVNLPKISG